MKVKEVRFEKLFSLAKYNNERIGFTVEVEEGDDADKVAGELFFKITNVEDCLNRYRSLSESIGYASMHWKDTGQRIRRTRGQMADMKVEIQELLAKAGKGDVDTKLRHACQRQSYKQLAEELAEYEKKYDSLAHKLDLLTKAKLELQKRIRQGDFSLEDIPIPELPSERVYLE